MALFITIPNSFYKIKLHTYMRSYMIYNTSFSIVKKGEGS